MIKYKLSRVQIIIILGIWSFFVSLLCNIDSYLYAQCGQYDSAWFFMCGKALMNGMVPYDDFSDSKGILLWFIYGLGYLIDNYSYVGIFWISWINLWVVLLVSFRTALFFLKDNAALLVAMLLIVPLTYWNFYIETKAEHFCWPAVAWGIYVLMKAFIGRCPSFRDCLFLGVGIVSCLMLKWSVAFMMLSFIFSVSWWAWRNKGLLKCISGFLCGILVGSLPFIVYFFIMDIWSDLWREYFCNTMSSVSMPLYDTLVVYAEEWKQLLTSHRILYLFYTLPVLAFWNKKDWFASAMPTLCGLFFVAVSIRHDFAHYVSIAGPFAVLSIIVVMQWVVRHRVRLRYVGIVLLLAASYVIWGSIHYSNTFCTKAGERFDYFMALSAAMSQVAENPTIINVGMETGLCQATILPGTRYWTTQHGRTAQMWAEELDGIRSGKADFVRCADGVPDYLQKILDDAGYVHWRDGIFVKGKLPELNEIKHFTALDIIRKKTYREVYFGE